MSTEAVSMPAAILPVETGNATRRFWNFVFYAVLTISAIIWIAPVYLLVSTAFKSALDFSTHGALALPSRIEWGNFAKAWDAGIKTYFFNSLKVYDIVYVMTYGGPANQTQVLGTWMYFLTYNFNRIGLGTAIAMVLFALTLIFAIPYTRKLSRD